MDTNIQSISKDVTLALDNPRKAKKMYGEFIIYCIDISGSMDVTVENTQKPDEKYVSRLFVCFIELKSF